MVSALLASRGQTCLCARRHSARATGVRRPVPFTPARRVFARAQEAEGAVAEAAEVEFSVGEAAEDFVLDDEDKQVLRDALEAAEALAADVDAVTAATVAAELEEEEEDKVEAAQALEDLLARKLQGDDDTLLEEELIRIAAVADGELDEAELEDFVPASANSDRYDEVPLSADDKVAVQPYKLTKGELRNLLPQDWDQINIDFFSNKNDENIPLPEYRLNVLWTDKNLAVAIDQVYSRGQVSPLTEYYFWPRQDAWEELRINLEARPWISERDRIILLNRLTQLINFWQDEEVKHSVDEARTEFPDCAFAVA